MRISDFSKAGNLGESSADILVGFGAFVNLRPTRMSAIQKNPRCAHSGIGGRNRLSNETPQVGLEGVEAGPRDAAAAKAG